MRIADYVHTTTWCVKLLLAANTTRGQQPSSRYCDHDLKSDDLECEACTTCDRIGNWSLVVQKYMHQLSRVYECACRLYQRSPNQTAKREYQYIGEFGDTRGLRTYQVVCARAYRWEVRGVVPTLDRNTMMSVFLPCEYITQRRIREPRLQQLTVGDCSHRTNFPHHTVQRHTNSCLAHCSRCSDDNWSERDGF